MCTHFSQHVLVIGYGVGQFLGFFFFNVFISCLCLHTCVWRSEDNFLGFGLSFCPVERQGLSCFCYAGYPGAFSFWALLCCGSYLTVVVMDYRASPLHLAFDRGSGLWRQAL